MPVQSAPNLVSWRSHYTARPHVVLYAPATVFTARVNMESASYPRNTIVFDTVGIGAFGDIVEGQTLNIGSAAGLHDKGRLLVKSATSTVITTMKFSRGVLDGEADLLNDLYLTVVDLRLAWSEAPYIDPVTGEQFKKGDVAFTEDVSRPPQANITFEVNDFRVNAGTSLITADFYGSSSYATARSATITAYLWTFPGGTPATATTADVTGVTFPAGNRYASLKITDSNGQTHTSYVFVPAVNDTTYPELRSVEITSHQINEDGQTIALHILQSIPETTYPDGTVMVLWYDEFYAGVQKDLTASADRKKLKFYGWHVSNSDSIKGTREGLRTDTTLNFVDIAGRLKQLPGFGIEISDEKPTPSTWSTMNDPNIDLYTFHILRWHSNALDLAPFLWANTILYQFPRLGSDGAALWEQASGRVEASAWKLTCDTKGILRMVLDGNLALDSAYHPTLERSTIDTIAALTEPDIAEFDYDHTYVPNNYQLEGDAIFAGTATYTPFFCIAPGSTPGQGVSKLTKGNQLASSQDELNAREGHRYAHVNRANKDFKWTPTHNGDIGAEPAYGEWLALTIGAAYAAQRGLTFTAERFQIGSVSVNYNGETGQIKREYALIQETRGAPAQTITIDPLTFSAYTPPYEIFPGSVDDDCTDTPGTIEKLNGDGTTGLILDRDRDANYVTPIDVPNDELDDLTTAYGYRHCYFTWDFGQVVTVTRARFTFDYDGTPDGGSGTTLDAVITSGPQAYVGETELKHDVIALPAAAVGALCDTGTIAVDTRFISGIAYLKTVATDFISITQITIDYSTCI